MAFSEKLLPTLKTLHRRHEEGGVWVRAERLFQEKSKGVASTQVGRARTTIDAGMDKKGLGCSEPRLTYPSRY